LEPEDTANTSGGYINGLNWVKLTTVNPRRKRRRRRRSRPVVQEHHITYTPEWTVKLYQGEHWVVTQMQRRRHWSRGAITAMRYILEQADKVAVDLGEGKTPRFIAETVD
jgi:hypothetical protein